MYPILFTVGGWNIPSSPFFLALGLLMGIWVGGKESRRVGLSRRDIFLFVLIAIPVALILGVVNDYVFRLIIYRDYIIHFDIIRSGLVSFGVVLGAFFISWLQSLISRLPPAKGMDVIALVLPLILAVYRIGCLMNGCCYGRETDGLLGMYLPGDFSEWAYRYPTQIMLMVFDWALFGFLWWRRTRREFEGSQTFAFLLIYSVGRFVIDSFRDLPPVALGLSVHQWMEIIMFVGTLAALAVVLVWRRKRALAY
jgi:phosphatidylglycerol---prolipoprotein diacylglyceryl transferase